MKPKALAEGLEGYRFFGLHEMAAIIQSYRREEEREANKTYYAFTQRPNQIQTRFEEMFREHPERFAPVDESASE